MSFIELRKGQKHFGRRMTPVETLCWPLFLRRTHVGVKAFSKRQNETRDRSRTSQNAFPPHETDQNFRKTPSRGGKWGKISEKRLPAAGNGKKRSKNGFPRREGGKIFWRSVSRHGKWGFFAEKRFPPPNHPTRPPQTFLHTTRCRAKKVASRNRVSFRLQLFRDLMATLPAVRTKGRR